MNSEFFYRVNVEGNAHIFNEDGSSATKLPFWGIYPIGSNLSVQYEHPQGIDLTLEEVLRLNIPEDK